MPDWKKKIRSRLAGLAIEPARESEIIDELAQHLEDRYAEYLADGVPEAEARRRVLAELRHSDLMQAELRRTEPPPAPRPEMFAGFAGDLRYAARTLRKSPGFTAFVSLALALGIGANTAVFTLINTMLLNPLPVRDSGRLVALEMQAGTRLLPLSWLNLKDYEQRNEVFSHVAGYTLPIPLTWSREERSERIFAQLVSANYFETLGLQPALGRFFRADEGGTGVHPVAVIGYSAWQQRFGGASDILGRTLRLNNQADTTIIGVAPEGFKGVTVIFGPDLWIPAGMADQLLPGKRKALSDRQDAMFHTAVRLRAGVSIRQAQADVQTIAAALKREYPELNQEQTAILRPLAQAAQGDSRLQLLLGGAVLMAVVGLLLLIACSNAAGLLLARASGRRREIAVRLAMGASRSRLIRQLLAESVMLGLLSGALGLAIGYAGCQLLWSFRPADVAANFVDAKMDAGVVAFAISVSILTGLIFGLVPALQSSRAELVRAIQEEGRTVGRSRRSLNFRNALLAGQVALSLVALITASLFLRSIGRAYQIDPGFQTGKLAVFLTNQGQAGYDRPRAEQFYREVRRRVESLPGVAAVSWSSNMPLWNSTSRAIVVEGQSPVRKQDAASVIANTVDLDYFATTGIPMLQGRDFAASDSDGSLPVAIVNQAMRLPVGRRFRFAGESISRQVVGVVKTANYTGLGEPPQPCVYLPLRQNFTPAMILYVRSKGPAASVLTAVQRELRSMDPQLDVSDARTGTKFIDQALWAAKMGVGLLSVFGFLGLGLASVGLYGIMAYSVSQRRREIGVRVALGAAQGSILRMVLRRGMTIVGTGVILGMGAALLVGRALSQLLYGVGAADPASLLGASTVLMAVALIACYLPARRASRMDPLAALRDE